MKYIILLIASFSANAAVSVLTPNMTQQLWDSTYFTTASNNLNLTCDPIATVTTNSCAEHFAWVQSRWIRAYLSMALVTGDVKYLDKSRDIIDFMMTKRSPDGGWGYELGQSQYLLDSAMVTHTIGMYVYVVNKDSRFINYRVNADVYLSIIEPVFHKFDYQWVENSTVLNASFYRYATCGGGRSVCGVGSLLMYNQGAALVKAGLLIDKIYRLKGLIPDPAYLDKATKAVQYFLSFVQNTNCYSFWNYGGGRADSGAYAEDLNHGHIDMMLLTWTNEIGGMNSEKLYLLSNTLARKLMDGEAGGYDVSNKVDGSGLVVDPANKAQVAIDYIELSDYNQMLLDRIIYLFNTKVLTGGNQSGALGWAEILRKKSNINLID